MICDVFCSYKLYIYYKQVYCIYVLCNMMNAVNSMREIFLYLLTPLDSQLLSNIKFIFKLKHLWLNHVI